MVTAAEVEQALRQRLEAKDVVRAYFERLIRDCDCMRCDLAEMSADRG